MKKFAKYIDLFLGFAPDVSTWKTRNLHVTFALHKNKLIAYGFNTNKTHPVNLLNPKRNSTGTVISSVRGTCSEWACINKVKKISNEPFNQLTFLNIRLNRDGKICNSSPCESCQLLFDYFQPKSVFYTNDEGIFEKYL